MSDNSDAEGLAPSLATQRLLAAATNLRIAPSRRAEASEDASSFAAFTKSYRDWIVTEHGTPGSPQERIERSQLILYAMVGASTLGEGLDLMARFT